MRKTKFTVPALTGVLCSLCISAQVITTVAGTDFVFPSSLSAVNAPLGRTYSVPVDANGNVYAADVDNQIVVRISPSGILTVVAGNGLYGSSGDGGPATSASLANPSHAALDSAGNLYFSESSRIRKVSGGTVTTVAGTVTPGSSGDGGPAITALLGYVNGLAMDNAGALYLSEGNNCRVRKIAAGVITTIAGNGTCAFAGDGGPATNASLNAPSGLAVDASGNLYIADAQNGRIRKVSAGVINTVAGGGTDNRDGRPALNAELGYPTGIVVAPSGDFYFSDLSNDRIYKVAGGIITSVAGNGQRGLSGDGGPALSASLREPQGLGLDAASNLYIADSGNMRIRRVTPSGIIGPVAGNGEFRFTGDGGPATSATFNAPLGLAVDAAGGLYIADAGNDRIRKVSRGIVTTFAGNGLSNLGDGGPAASASLSIPVAVAVDAAGAVYIADAYNNRVRKVSGGTITTVAGNGTDDFKGDGGPATNASLNHPVGVTVDSAGNLYIADGGNSRIRKVSNGIITTIAGNGMEGFSGDGGPATSASLRINVTYPVGLALDPSGNLLLTDPGNYRIRRVSGGIIDTVAGNGTSDSTGDLGPATSATLAGPAGIAVDQAGNLYIADYASSIVRKVSNGIITTAAGNGLFTFSGDGGPATEAALNQPSGVALDSAGNLYIVDQGNDRVREVLKVAPSFQVSPSTLSFSAPAGGVPPAAGTVNLSSSATGLSYTTFASASWLTVDPPGGSIPATLQISVDPSQLTAGKYVATLTINAPNAFPATQTVTVNLTVGPPISRGLAVSSQNLSFVLTQGASPGSSQLTVSNPGSGTVGFTATASTSSGGTWLQVAPFSGTVTATTPASVTVTADPGLLAAGTYSGTITVASPDTGQSLAISVTLAVSAPLQEILLSQSGFTFTAVAQGGTVLPQSLGILNVGAGTLNWSASISTRQPASGWLSVSAASGSVSRPFLDVSFLDVSVDAGGLAPGTYYGQVQVSAVGASNSPQTAPVVLTVLPPGSNPGPEVRPIGLVFTGVAGSGNPGSQSVAVANVTANPISYGSSAAYVGAANWIQYVPPEGTVPPDAPARILVQPDFGKLAAGPHRAALTLAFDDGTIRTVSILAVVAPAGASAGPAFKDSPRLANACAPTKLLPQFTLVATGSNATVGYPAAIAAKIVDDCGGALTDGSVVVSFSNGDAPLSLVSLQDGTWTNSWQPNHAAASVTLRLLAREPALGIEGSTQAASVGLQQGSQAPPTLSGGPLGAVTLTEGPFAPGDVMLLKGAGLANGQASATIPPLQDKLAGASLVIGGRTASLLYADSGNIVGLVPQDTPVNTSQQVLLTRDNALGLPVPVIIAATHPAILTRDGSGAGQGLIYKAGGATPVLADSANPIRAGDSITIYCTGLGATDASGKVTNPVTVSIGGQPAQVSYAGNALPQSYPPEGAPTLLGMVSAGLGGLYQITATVPGALVNGAAAVTIRSGGQTSQAGVTLTAGGGSASGGVPVIAAVENAATGQINDARHGAAPNSIISIFSSNIGTTSNPSLFPATNFQGLLVLFNGKPAPLYAVIPSANQINLAVPSELPSSGTAALSIQNSSGVSQNIALSLAQDSVGIFRIPDATHPNNAAVQFQNTAWDVMPASTAAFYGLPPCTGRPVTASCGQPAKPGDGIVIYFTGGGLATPNGDPSGQPVLTGSVAPVSGNPVFKTVEKPTLSIGGISAPVLFSGIAPGTAAEYQLNTQIPLGVQPGDAVPVVLTFANSSDSVTIAVQAP